MSWRKVKLGEVCRIEKGAIGIQKAIPGEFPLVVTGEERKSHNEFQFDDEAVIIPLVSGTGHGHASIKRIHFQKGKFALGSILCAVIPKDKTQLNAEYLFRFLDLNKENELVARMKGMANVSLPLKEIAQIEIPLPSYKEQIEFVEKYNYLEVKSEMLASDLAHQLSLVKRLRQQILQDTVQGKLVTQNPNDEPADELLKRIKAEKVKLIAEKKLKKEKELPAIKLEVIPFEIPENWVWCRFGLLGNCRLGKMLDGTKNKGEFVKYLRNTNVQWNQIDLDDIKKIRLEKHEIEEYKLIEGDLLICEGGVPGRCAIWKGSDEYYSFQKALHRFRSNGSVITEYITYYLEYIYNNEILYQYFTGNQIKHLTGQSLEKVLIPLPPLSEQFRIVKKLEELLQTCNELESSIQQSAWLNEKLLQQVLREALQEKD